MDEMENSQLQRRWITNGPTLQYKRWSRSFFWMANLVLYMLLNAFYLRLQTGSWLQLAGPYESEALIPRLLTPLNIFQFPDYLVVVAFVMALTCVVPILIAQFYSFLYAIPFLFAIFFLGQNPILTLSLIVSCFAASFDPLRFKSKFVAVLLCLLPVLLYWGLFSGANPERDILRWAVLYSPWGLAFFICLVFFGIVLVIGHVFRYRPGVMLPVFGFSLAFTVLFFRSNIGMNERDFQAEVYRFSHRTVPEFQTRTITGLLEKELNQREKQFPYLSRELITRQIRMEWRWAMNADITALSQYTREWSADNPISLAKQEAIRVEGARLVSLKHMDEFIQSYPSDKRVADALYYKSLLMDLKVDSRSLRDEDVLVMYPGPASSLTRGLWQEILDRFGQRDLSVQARYKLSRLMASQKPVRATDSYPFEQALEMLHEARGLCVGVLQKRKPTSLDESHFWPRQFGAVFTDPPVTISYDEMVDLYEGINRLMVLISAENRTGYPQHEQRLARFVGLDPRQLDYEGKLKELRLDSGGPDPLQDNIELALIRLIKGRDERMAALSEMIHQFGDTDGGVQAMFELAGLLDEQSQRESYLGDRQRLVQQRIDLLQRIVLSRGDSYLGEKAKEQLHLESGGQSSGPVQP